jgi:hypothetical protein
VLSPRLTINLRYNTRQSPTGSYVAFEDGLEYFAQSDETRNSTLGRIDRLRAVARPFR